MRRPRGVVAEVLISKGQAVQAGQTLALAAMNVSASRAPASVRASVRVHVRVRQSMIELVSVASLRRAYSERRIHPWDVASEAMQRAQRPTTPSGFIDSRPSEVQGYAGPA